MKKLLVITAAVIAFASTSARAEDPSRKLSIAPFVGAFVGTGDQRDLLDDSVLTGLTLSYEVHPYVAIVGAVGWSPTQVKALGEHLDLFQYDLGVQGQYPVALAQGWTLKPFVGIGAGARTYSFRDLDVDSETDFAGYVSAGANVEHGAFGLGLTARDYVTAFDGLASATIDQTARNDLGLFGSVSVRF
ncbi:outer membrane beta-barrel protein [Anaeromyxobacter sp. SG17]|uniref:outer membrane beta-barrel protein n=1 Tax=Anaeromyxobacter sp. SG17 TaxID=2925405 RepID=UPI001F597F20|nr:outer membrane beta-barrel protein [Anaeromyxobacter sp. SG17]